MKVRILVVDDDKNLRDVIKEVLEMNNYEVTLAENGLEALKLFEENNFDIILTDLKMDKMDGIEFVKNLKSKYNDIPPIILMTGYGSVDSAIEAFKIGIKDYILKPFKFSTLDSVIQKVLKQHQIERENLQLKEVITLYSASERINNSIYVEKVGKSLVDSIVEISKADIVALYLYDQEKKVLKIYKDFFKVSQKLKSEKDKYANIFFKNLKFKDVKEVINDRKYTVLFKRCNLFPEIKFVQSVIYKLQTVNNFIGILVLISLTKSIRFPEEKIKAYRIIIDESSIAIENALLFKQHQEMFFQTLNSLALTIDAKDRYTHGHSLKVTKYAEIISQEMNLGEEVRKNIVEGGLLHDIGKIGIPDAILLKPTKLTDIEYKIIKTHPTIGKNILEPLRKNFGKVIDIVYFHHERWDGKGYPTGIKGEDIPIEVRIVTIADAFDAMTSDRAYRKAMNIEKALNEIKRNRGTQFDPVVVDAFFSCFNDIEKFLDVKPEDVKFENIEFIA